MKDPYDENFERHEPEDRKHASTSKPRAVAVLFSGGDAPGMNPLLRYLVRLGLNRHGAKVLGVKDGYAGLVRTAHRIRNGGQTVGELREAVSQDLGTLGLFRRGLDIITMNHASVSGLAARGGVALGAVRCPEFLNADTRLEVANLVRVLEINALIAVGGNGTLRGAHRLVEETGVPVVGVPATIDNDVDDTETTLGFDTAVNTIVRALEQINDTAGSHHRIIVVETMGRDCGNLAGTAALAAGVEIVITPERGLLTIEKMQAITERLQEMFVRGRSHAIVLIAEGVKTEDSAEQASAAAVFRRYLEDRLGTSGCPILDIEVRDTTLGHVQRGGSPTAADRILAARFAETAWVAAMAGAPVSGVVGLRGGRVVLQQFGDREPALTTELQTSLYAIQKSVSKWM